MSGDYSRIADDPRRNYSGVLLQQGRPLTDRDWNESVAVVNRRAQAGTLDTSGPVVISTATPDAFLIKSDGSGGLLIGRGRLYVDGLLADNHGTGASKWDVALAEAYGADFVSYTKQPYLPNAAALPKVGGPNLVYLDVWQREVTQLEDPDLVEKALGVDTTTRQQTAWQVNLLGGIANDVTCATPLDQVPAWKTLTAPSAGRLSTGTGQVPGDADPCLIPPSGGYKGLENQLYRVEIHKAGLLGTSTFKWSRDDASVATRVTRLIDSTHIVVENIGKDSVLRFSDGDWIEIIDDWLELTGQPGALRRIKIGGGVDDATRTITLDKPLTAGLFPADAQGNLDAGRHTRIRRWDQKGKILDKDGKLYGNLDDPGSDGAITVPTAGLSLLLENGVLVSFGTDPAGGSFRVGDYWVFAARTSDASVEILDSAPPRGIHHHYAKLAVFTPPAGIQDCRPKEEACCCTVTVRPGEDIQLAIDSLPKIGGCVCLKTGVHTVPQMLKIAQSNVRVVGESPGTVVRTSATGAVLLIGSSPLGTIEGVEVSTITFERLGPPGNFPGVVTVVGVRRSALLDCGFRAAAPPSIGVVAPARSIAVVAAAPSIGVQIADGEQIRIARCRIEPVVVGILASGKQVKDLILENNVLDFGTDMTKASAGFGFGIIIQGIATSCRIEGNLLRGVSAGIIVNDNLTGRPQPSADGIIVTKNVVTCAPAPTDTAADTGLFGIDVAANSSIVSQNILKVPGGTTAHTAIRVTGQNIDLIDNQIAAANPSQDKGTGVVGIQVGYAAGDASTLTSDVRVAGNVVDGCRIAITATTADDVIIESNLVDIAPNIADPTGNFGISLAKIKDGQVHGNRVSGGGSAISCLAGIANRVSANVVSHGSVGVMMNQETGPIVSQNRIDSMLNWGVICTTVVGRCDIVENRVTFCGFGIELGVGIRADRVLGELLVEANEVMDTGLSADSTKTAKVAHGISGTSVLEACIDSNLVTYSNPGSRSPTGEDRALFMTCFQETTTSVNVTPIATAPVTAARAAMVAAAPITASTLPIGPGGVAAGPPIAGGAVTLVKNGYPLQILGNRFYGTGLTALVQVAEQGDAGMRFERVFFSNNYCLHLAGDKPEAPKPKDAATVWLTGRSASAIGNHIKATTKNFASMNFNGTPGPVIGNVTTSSVLNHTDFPTPQSSFNQIM